jgi:hypothetical protein
MVKNLEAAQGHVNGAFPVFSYSSSNARTLPIRIFLPAFSQLPQHAHPRSTFPPPKDAEFKINNRTSLRSYYNIVNDFGYPKEWPWKI